MERPKISSLPNRGVIIISGNDARSFLQGIISADTEKVSADQTSYGAFLTPQGKYLFDFFMLECNGNIAIDTERTYISDFIKRLKMYKLRADVEFNDASDQYSLAAVYGNGALSTLLLDKKPGHCVSIGSKLTYTDPRLSEAGARIMLPSKEIHLALNNPAYDHVAGEDYDSHRINLGLPDSKRDLITNKSVLLENGFDELNGIDWEKGCYVGQEVTARMKYRGLLKKRLMPVSIRGDTPEPGSKIMSGDRNAGEMRSACDDKGLALIRRDCLNDEANPITPLTVGKTVLLPKKPNWMIL